MIYFKAQYMQTGINLAYVKGGHCVIADLSYLPFPLYVQKFYLSSGNGVIV